MSGLIIDIHRCSIHDGPGVRTTVFFKGCPLRCKWCHNPESLSFKKQLSFNELTCINCLACVDICPHQAHQVIESKHSVDFSKCVGCGKCQTACLTHSLRLVGEEKSVEDILKIIKKDKSFYQTTGGGVTLSGGEILSHSEKASEILAACQQEQIHTCIETSGFGTKKAIDTIVPFVDLVLFDYKVTDEQDHLTYVGVKNKQILDNLAYLNKLNQPVILRCPIIPTVNDNEKHFEAIDKLLTTYPNLLRAELLPYHNFGMSKAKNIGYDKIQTFEPPTAEDKKRWLTYFKWNHDKVLIN